MRFLPGIFCWGYLCYLIISEPLLIQRGGLASCTGKTLLVVLLLAVYLTIEPLFFKKRKATSESKGEKTKVSDGSPQLGLDEELNKAQEIITDLKLRLKKDSDERSALEEALKIARAKLAETKKDVTASERDRQIDAEIVNLLSLMQERGRLFDFLMDDITPYSDAQVGVAARVVHQGLASLLKEYFEVAPVHPGQEGEQVNVGAEQSQNGYSLLGRISEAANAAGTVVHRGWKTRKISLPRVVSAEQSLAGKGIIAPAQVEIK